MSLRLAVPAMGTRFELVLAGSSDVHLRAAGEEAIAEIERCDRQLSLFRRDSLLSHINRHAGQRPVSVDREMFTLLLLCRTVYEQSGGAFDITLAPLMRAWGFHTGGSGGVGGSGGSLGSRAIQEARASCGMEHLVLDEDAGTVSFAVPGMALDLGAAGKGHALDLVVEVLEEAGITVALAHGGTSTVVAIGAPEGHAGWGVGIRLPGGQQDGLPRVILRDAALSVSAPHGRMVEMEEGSAGHVIDPRSGAPASAAGLAAVIADAALTADAWSTALLVLADRPVSLDDACTTILPPRPGMPGAGWRVHGSRSGVVEEMPDGCSVTG